MSGSPRGPAAGGAGRRGLLADVDQRAAMNIVAEEICGIRWRLLQRDFRGCLLVVAFRQQLGQTWLR